MTETPRPPEWTEILRQRVEMIASDTTLHWRDRDALDAALAEIARLRYEKYLLLKRLAELEPEETTRESIREALKSEAP